MHPRAPDLGLAGREGLGVGAQQAARKTVVVRPSHSKMARPVSVSEVRMSSSSSPARSTMPVSAGAPEASAVLTRAPAMGAVRPSTPSIAAHASALASGAPPARDTAADGRPRKWLRYRRRLSTCEGTNHALMPGPVAIASHTCCGVPGTST